LGTVSGPLRRQLDELGLGDALDKLLDLGFNLDFERFGNGADEILRLPGSRGRAQAILGALAVTAVPAVLAAPAGTVIVAVPVLTSHPEPGGGTNSCHGCADFSLPKSQRSTRPSVSCGRAFADLESPPPQSCGRQLLLQLVPYSAPIGAPACPQR